MTHPAPSPMFSIFRHHEPAEADLYDPRRLVITNPDALDSSLSRAGESPVPVALVDLSVSGASVHVRSHLDPNLGIDDIVEITISGTGEEWTLTTSAMVYERAAEVEMGRVKYGLDFVNEGDLFAKLEEAAGRWFNRRRNQRAKPELDCQPRIDISYKHYRSRGLVFDVSVTGLCAKLDPMAASPFRVGDLIQMSFELPGIKRPFDCTGVLRTVRRFRGSAYVGVEFDLEESSQLSRRHYGELVTYVEKRLNAMSAFGRSLREDEPAE